MAHPHRPLRRLAHGISWTALGAVLSRVALLAGTIVCARILGPIPYGKLALLQNGVLTLGTFAGLGMAVTVTKHLSEMRTREPELASRLLGLTLLLSLASACVAAGLLALLRAPVAAGILHAPDVAPLLPVTAITLVFTVLAAVQSAALAGFEAFPSLAAANFASGIATAAFTVSGAALGELEGALLGAAAGGFFSAAVLAIAVRRSAYRFGFVLRFEPRREDLRLMIGASLPMLLAGVIPPAVTTLTGTMLARTQGGYAELGLFAAADQWRTAILFLPALMSQASLPILTDLYAGGDLVSYRRLFQVNLLGTSAICLGAATVITLAGPAVMAIYGKAYAPHSDVLMYCCAGAALAGIAGVAAQVLTSSGRYWLGFQLNLVWAIVLLAFGYLSRADGALGLARAYCLSYAVHLALVATVTFLLARGPLSVPDHRITKDLA